VEAHITKAREGDLKMVRELSEEVKRLVALLPRGSIDDAEPPGDSTEREDGGTQADASEEDASEDDKLSRNASKESVSSSATGKNIAHSGRITEPAPSRSGVHNPNEMYSPGQLLCSFFAGVIVMLLCVALSTYGFYYATAGGADAAGSSPPHRGSR
jgi:hypothetical protein